MALTVAVVQAVIVAVMVAVIPDVVGTVIMAAAAAVIKVVAAVVLVPVILAVITAVVQAVPAVPHSKFRGVKFKKETCRDSQAGFFLKSNTDKFFYIQIEKYSKKILHFYLSAFFFFFFKTFSSGSSCSGFCPFSDLYYIVSHCLG